MRVVLVIVAGTIGAVAITPIAGALAAPVTGGVVPTRFIDLTRYLTGAVGGGVVAPTTQQATDLRELAALSLASGAVIAALSYVLLSRALS